MTQSHRIETLEVIGYATRLTEHMVPTIVPPIFHLKSDPDRVVYPPFQIYQGCVKEAMEIPREELAALEDRGELVLLPEPLAARDGFELWVDENMEAHYQDQLEVTEGLVLVFQRAVEAARLALERGNLEEADQLASRALSANDCHVEPYAIKAAINRHQGSEAAVKVMARMASKMYDSALFEKHVGIFSSLIPRRQDSLMRGVAKRKPEDILECAA